MKKLKPHNADAEVIGSTFKSYFVSINLDNFKDILKSYGLSCSEDIDPNAWYKHSLCMDIFREIEKQPAMFDEVSLGIASVRVGNLRQLFESAEEALKALPRFTQASHRNTTDYIKVDICGDHHAVIEDHTVWPHSAMYGVLWEVVHTFSSDFVVKRTGMGIDPVTGDEFGIYDARWKD